MTAQGQIVVNPEELRGSARRLDAGRTEIGDKLGELKRMIDQLVQTSFSGGTAPGKFLESYEQWDKGAKAAVAGLEGMSGFLTKAAQSHIDLDTGLAAGAKQA